MEHNLAQYRTQLLLSRFYGASPVFLEGIGWRPERRGHVLVDEKCYWRSNVVVAVVGRVLDYRLHCGPNGNHVNPLCGPLAIAKFELQLAKPYRTPFAADYDTVLDNLGKLSAQIACTPGWQNLIVTVDERDKNLRFAQNVFEKREHKIQVPDLEDLDEEGDVESKDISLMCAEELRQLTLDEAEGVDIVDAETENWPVSSNLREELDMIKYEYCAQPLRVYRGDDTFVEPRDVNETIRGALVELHFELHHSCNFTRDQDSFNGSIEQIMVLQPGEPRPTSPYKRRNVRDGPIRLNPTLALMMEASSSSQPGPSNSQQSPSEQAEASSDEQTPSTSTMQRARNMGYDSETASSEDENLMTGEVSGKGKGKERMM